MLRSARQILVVGLVVVSLLSPFFLTNAHATCLGNCNVETDTNVPASYAAVWVRADGGSPFQFNHTFSFPFNTTHTLEVMNATLSVPSTGTRYVFKQWLLNGIQWGTTPIVTVSYVTVDYTSSSGFGAFEAQFEKQVQLSLSFTDPSGQSLNPPSSITLGGPYSVTLTYTSQSVNQYSNQWLSASLWTVSDATWEGVSVISGAACCSGQLIDLRAGPTSATVKLGAYPASIKLIDNSNNPVTGARVTVTLVNGTSRTFTSDSQGTVNIGRIPQGPYTAHIIYQSQDQSYSIDALQYPVDTIKLDIGGATSAPIVSAVVLLAIFGIAFFLILLAIKVQKGAPPPKIN